FAATQQIAFGDDADHLAAPVDHRQAADLVSQHGAGGVDDCRVHVDAQHVVLHHVGGGQLFHRKSPFIVICIGGARAGVDLDQSVLPWAIASPTAVRSASLSTGLAKNAKTPASRACVRISLSLCAVTRMTGISKSRPSDEVRKSRPVTFGIC